jgi:hypothetical protein
VQVRCLDSRRLFTNYDTGLHRRCLCFVLFCWGVFIYCLPVPYIHYLFSTYDRLSNR